MSDEMVTRVGYDPLVRVLDRLDKMLTAAGSPPETPHEEAVGALIAERDRLREALREIAVWSQEIQDEMVAHDACLAQWRGCVAIAREALEVKP